MTTHTPETTAAQGPGAQARPRFARARAARDLLVASPMGSVAGLVALILGRLSTDTEQNQDNELTQVEQCLGWCSLYGLKPYQFPDGAQAFVMRGQPIYGRPEPWPGYLLAWDLIAQGAVQAIVAQFSDRFLRDVGDAVRFYDHCKLNGMRTIVFNGQLYDLQDPNHYDLLIKLASAGQAESALKRVRALNKGTQKARSGAAAQGGLRPFGYQAGGLKLNKPEAKELEKMVTDFLAGKPLIAIADDLNCRGVKTSQGKQWTHTTVKQTISNWRIAGIRSHYDEPVTQGSWPAIVTRAQLEAVRGILLSRSRPKGRPKQLLTGLMGCTCGCGWKHHGATTSRMQEGHRVRLPGYIASDPQLGRGGHCSVMAADVEAEVVARFFSRISNGAWKKLAAVDNSQARADLQAQLQCLESAAADQVALHARGKLTTAQLEAGQEISQAEAQAIRTQLALLAVPVVTGGDLEHIQSRWDQLTLQAQRQHLEALVESVQLDPWPRKHPWDPCRVHVLWKH